MTRNETPADDGLPVEEAIETYLSDREDELSASTLQAHGYRLGHLPRFCAENGIESVEELSPMDFKRYKKWRKRDGDLNVTSVHTQLATVRVFVKWCEDVSLLPDGVHEAVRPPNLDGQDRRDTLLDGDVARRILDHLDRYDYASVKHVLLRLFWRCGVRIGAIHSLDRDDFDAEKKQLTVRHRPAEGTTLKKKGNGERNVALNDVSVAVVADYVEVHRRDVVDDYGRDPLVTSAQGRLTKGSMRRHIYEVTQPCFVTNECPHDRVVEECEARGYSNSKDCPSSKSPHDIRRGSITHFLSNDVPKEIVQDRADVSAAVVDKHYDVRTEAERAEQRRKYFTE